MPSATRSTRTIPTSPPAVIRQRVCGGSSRSCSKLPIVQLPLDFIIVGGGGACRLFPFDPQGYYKRNGDEADYYEKDVVSVGVDATIQIEYQCGKVGAADHRYRRDVFFEFLNPGPTDRFGVSPLRFPLLSRAARIDPARVSRFDLRFTFAFITEKFAPRISSSRRYQSKEEATPRMFPKGSGSESDIGIGEEVKS